MILDKILENKKREIEKNRKFYEGLSKKKTGDLLPSRNFLSAISSPGKINLIAEIKRFSPSNPGPVKNFKPSEIARAYMENGASAISVVTDKAFFGGSFEMLSAVKSAVALPVLCKDFILTDLQVNAAYAGGADAILLIMRILTDRKVRDLAGLAESLGMDPVFEVHSEKELERAIASGAQIIGINNRNLDTLEIDLNTTFKLIKKIPGDRIIISESGIKTREDVLRLKEAGVNAILVGETLLRSSSIAEKIKELLK